MLLTAGGRSYHSGRVSMISLIGDGSITQMGYGMPACRDYGRGGPGQRSISASHAAYGWGWRVFGAGAWRVVVFGGRARSGDWGGIWCRLRRWRDFGCAWGGR